jgi:DNA mismatch repair protein MutS
MDSKITPAMKQYLDMKKQYPEEILFFRMGDFYEMFFEDAHAASKILDIALTSRQNDIPMCGIPYHAADSYIARLIKAGKRVAICEQMEAVPSSGPVVRREVVRVITPGTVVEANLLQSDENNFLSSIIIDKSSIGLAFIDISTGDFFLSTIEKSMDLFRGEIMKFNPREAVLYEGDSPDSESYSDYIKMREIPIYRINEWLYDLEFMSKIICETFRISGTKGLGITTDLDLMTAGSILQYLKEAHKKTFDHLKYPRKILSRDIMTLDEATISNLELVRNTLDGSKSRTLFSVLDYTRTAMGKRALERNILQPLLDISAIERRLDIVQYFHEYHELAEQVLAHLKEIHDIERLLSRFIIGRTFPRNFIAIMNSIRAAMKIKSLLAEQPHEQIKEISDRMPDTSTLATTIKSAVEDEPALSPEHGRVIRKGFNQELDRIYELKINAKNWIIEYQEEEKKKLGISTLRIRYNKILGYFIEVSKGQASNIPEDYYRKQTLVGSERYTTDKLQDFESEILSASEKIVQIENEEIDKLLKSILSTRIDLQAMAATIGDIDFFCSLACSAIQHRYIRPAFNADNITRIKEGRHPVVEKYYTREVFIPNDINLDGEENIIKIITGPNMSGKSTYIRMAAIIQLMSQIGSFIPAREANLAIVDRIFTRIGASDNISRGESTFLVEMNETASILNNATERSLIIMDEIGRGTSTYDGLSIAWAVVEYILRYLKARTLFATHYHELTQLGSRKGIINYTVLVKEHLNGVDFLHKVVRGAADKSYGIHVANLAGIPKPVIGRAEQILLKLEKGRKNIKPVSSEDEETSEQLEIFNASNHRVIQALQHIDLNTLTPIDALNELSRLKKLIE